MDKLEGKSLRQQAALYYNASIVIQTHGAALGELLPGANLPHCCCIQSVPNLRTFALFLLLRTSFCIHKNVRMLQLLLLLVCSCFAGTTWLFAMLNLYTSLYCRYERHNSVHLQLTYGTCRQCYLSTTRGGRHRHCP